jgi:selenocysteine-specific elongation factor
MTGIRNVIVGTAGHIDHGKSAIVRRLTGVDPDRLAEERERGMTIDLGFAPYTHASGATVGLIDVPGHERFIKNMVAGATSVDIVMLVVAADDGVMPQTREHLAILDLLGVSRGLVVINKIDLVDEELLELVRLDLDGLLEETFLASAPRCAVSATSGDGFDALRAALDALISDVPPHEDDGPFRLPIQRVFSAKGHGTVVTGVPVSGKVAAGDKLEIVGRDLEVRVRGVQAYGEARDEGRAGHSTAINISGASKDQVRRGDVIARQGLFAARPSLAVHYRHVAEQPLKNRAAIRLHVGTAEILGQAVLLDADRLARGEESFLQLRLDEPVVTAPGDRYLLRHAASMAVLGGGSILAAGDGRLKRFKERVLSEARERLASHGDALGLARVAITAAGRRGATPEQLTLETGMPAEAVREALRPAIDAGELVAAGSRLVDSGALDEVAAELRAAVKSEHKRFPLLDWLELKSVRARLDIEDSVLAAALERDRRLESATGGRVRLSGHAGRLSNEQRAASDRILDALRRAGATPPAIDAAFTGLPPKESDALVSMLRTAGEIVSVGPHLYHAAALTDLRALLLAHGRARDGAIDIPALRDELGTSRKFLIPLLEHFDAEGLTVRHGDRRTLRRVDVSP